MSQLWLWELAGRLVPSQGAGKFNQALMDLGALICTPRTPSCLICPLAACCEARRLGVQDVLPVLSPKPPPLAVVEACALVVRKGAVLVVQREEGGLWSKFWEFPTVNIEGADPAGRSFGSPVDLAEGIERLTGIRARVGPEVRSLTYAVTKHRVSLRVHLAEAVSGKLKPGPGLSDARFTRPSGTDRTSARLGGSAAGHLDRPGWRASSGKLSPVQECEPDRTTSAGPGFGYHLSLARHVPGRTLARDMLDQACWVLGRERPSGLAWSQVVL